MRFLKFLLAIGLLSQPLLAQTHISKTSHANLSKPLPANGNCASYNISNLTRTDEYQRFCHRCFLVRSEVYDVNPCTQERYLKSSITNSYQEYRAFESDTENCFALQMAKTELENKIESAFVTLDPAGDSRAACVYHLTPSRQTRRTERVCSGQGATELASWAAALRSVKMNLDHLCAEVRLNNYYTTESGTYEGSYGQSKGCGLSFFSFSQPNPMPDLTTRVPLTVVTTDADGVQHSATADQCPSY